MAARPCRSRWSPGPVWHVDETFAALRGGRRSAVHHGPADEVETPPTIRRTGPFLYLRLRRHDYDAGELDAWAARLEPFLDDGLDAFVFFRHDEDGPSAIHAAAFAARRGRRGRLTTNGGRTRAISRPARALGRAERDEQRQLSVMSWMRCGTPLATKIEPGSTSRTSSPTVIRPRPLTT